jgi:hypothetical protein
MKKSQTNKQAPAKSAPTAPAAEVDLEEIASAFHPHEDDGGYGSDAAFRAPAPTEKLVLTAHKIEELAIRLGQILKKSGQFFRRGCSVFQLRGSKLVEINAEEAQTVIPRFFCRFAESRQNPKTKEYEEVSVDIPSRKMATMWNSPLLREQLPEPRCVLSWSAPVIEGGKVRLLPRGYDEKSGVLTRKETKLDSMNLEQSVKILRDVLSEFPFANPEVDLACHLGAMLTIFGLPMLPQSALIPGVVYSANLPRSGKSLLAKMLATTIQGEEAAVQTLAREDKLQPTMDAIALAGAPLVFFDNVKRKIDSPVIESWMTSSAWEGRHYHTLKTFRVRKQCMVEFSANCPSASDDIVERVLICELHRREADPSARKISRPMDETYLLRPDVRKQLLSALWGLVRAWVLAGRPRGSGRIRPGYETWSHLVPPILEHAGFASPLADRQFIQMDRPGTEAAALIATLFSKYALPAESCDSMFTLTQIWAECVDAELFAEKLPGRDGKVSKEDGPSATAKSALAKALAPIFGADFEHRMVHRVADEHTSPAPPIHGDVGEVWEVDAWRGGGKGHRTYHIKGRKISE